MPEHPHDHPAIDRAIRQGLDEELRAAVDARPDIRNAKAWLMGISSSLKAIENDPSTRYPAGTIGLAEMAATIDDIVERAEIGETTETVYQRMKESASALRWERDLYREALDAIVRDDSDTPLAIATEAIALDDARRRRNVEAMRAGDPLPPLPRSE